MNKKVFISIFSILITILIMSVFFITKKTSPTNIEGDVHENRGGEIPQKEIAKNNNNVVISENEIMKNISMELGINDSQLKYNEDGTVDVDNWKEYHRGSVKVKYPNNWYEIERGIANNSTKNYEAHKLLSNQIKISFSGAPVDFGNADTITDEERDEVIGDVIDRFKDNSTKCMKEVKVKNGIILICLENKKDVIVKSYLKLNKLSSGSWEQLYVLIEASDESALNANKYIINEIMNSLFIGDNKYVK